MLRSTKAKAKIIDVKLPKLLDGYFYVDKTDVPSDNRVNIVKDDMPVYAEETVEYIGEPIGMVCSPDEEIVNKILSEIEVVYEELDSIINIRDFDTVFFDYNFGKGDVEKAFLEADKIYEEEFETGYQDQTSLETQGLMAEVMPDGKVYVQGSMQCLYYVKGAVMRAMNLGPVKIGLNKMRECDAFFLLPGDMPAINPYTFLKLIDKVKCLKNKFKVIFPTIEGYKKHPPLISKVYISDILEFKSDGGLRELWKNLELNILTIPVDDTGRTIDVNTKIQYKEVCNYMRA